MADRLRYQTAYRRRLPHIQPPAATLFVTFRLVNTIPVAVLRKLADEAEYHRQTIDRLADSGLREAALYDEHKRAFGRIDAILDHGQSGERWLGDSRIADLVVEAMHALDGQRYTLEAHCVMPNHVHLVMTPLAAENGYHALARIMYCIKRPTAIAANRLLGRQGPFWQSESYDHVVRNPDELRRIVAYVLLNPVKAGLVDTANRWLWSYSRSGAL